jgi:hypothetical protein
MGINATSLFDTIEESNENEDEEKNLLDFKITDFALQQGADIPLSSKDSATINVSISSQSNKIGSGSLGGSFRRVMSSNSWIECRGSIGTNKSAVIKGFRRFTQKW